jgi:5-formyltetrahydrofolate cyclo-ligase
VSEPRDIAAEKDGLRDRIRAMRSRLDLDASLDASERLSARLLALPAVTDASLIASYHAMPEEIDPALAIEKLRARGTAIVYPRIDAPGIIGLRRVDEGTSLLLGPFGLAEPPADSPIVEPDLVDVVIVPGVAFDPAGRRLGYGGGYYDRLLPRLRPDCLTIGIAFDEQVVDRVPSDVHDVRVKLLVTPTRTIETDRESPR